MKIRYAVLWGFVGVCFNAKSHTLVQSSNIDSLFSVVSSSIYQNPDLGLSTAFFLEPLLLEPENTGGLAKLYKLVASTYQQKADYSKAIEYSHKSIDLYRTGGDSLGVASNFIDYTSSFLVAYCSFLPNTRSLYLYKNQSICRQPL